MIAIDRDYFLEPYLSKLERVRQSEEIIMGAIWYRFPFAVAIMHQ